MHRRSPRCDASALIKRLCVGAYQTAMRRRSSSNLHAALVKRPSPSGEELALMRWRRFGAHQGAMNRRSSHGDASALIKRRG
eukprot:1233211-Alexandrium_andersonii.AAC.1